MVDAVTTPAVMPREGMLIPGFALPRGDGRTVRLRAYRGRRSLALVFTHGPACDACRTYLEGAMDRYDAYAEAGAEVLAMLPAEREAATEMRRRAALPFPVLVDVDGAVFARYGLEAGCEAAVMVADRYGEPRLWQLAGSEHDLPEHDAVLAELNYLALTCGGGCSRPEGGWRSLD